MRLCYKMLFLWITNTFRDIISVHIVGHFYFTSIQVSPTKCIFQWVWSFSASWFRNVGKTKSCNWIAEIQATKTKLWSIYRFICKFQASFLRIWIFPWNLVVVPQTLTSKGSVNLLWNHCFRLQPHKFRGSTSDCNQVRAWSSWLWRLPNTQ